MNEVQRRVLVVEDDIDLAQAVADLLGDEGFFVEQRHDGQSGLAAALEASFDVIVSACARRSATRESRPPS